jgi:hypothetical protein
MEFFDPPFLQLILKKMPKNSISQSQKGVSQSCYCLLLLFYKHLQPGRIIAGSKAKCRDALFRSEWLTVFFFCMRKLLLYIGLALLVLVLLFIGIELYVRYMGSVCG